MADLDYPGYCPTCGEKCPIDKNVAHDLDAVRTREHASASGYTKTLANNLKDAFPDRIKTDEEAMMVLDVFETALVNGLKNNNSINIQGLSGAGQRIHEVDCLIRSWSTIRPMPLARMSSG